MSVRTKVVRGNGEPFPFEFEFIDLPRKGDVVNLGQPYAYEVLKVTFYGIVQGDDAREMGIKLTVEPTETDA